MQLLTYLGGIPGSVSYVTDDKRGGVHHDNIMERLQEFQAAAREGGFVEGEECEDGTNSAISLQNSSFWTFLILHR